MTSQGTVSVAPVEVVGATPGGCSLWGILNVTPDSFSDGGLFLEAGAALARAEALIAAGADVIDVGGASSRPRGSAYGPGAATVQAEVELQRVEPVITALCRRGIAVSIDTTSAAVARAALAAGARIINDVSCAAHPELLEVAAEGGAAYVLMHSRGDGAVTPENARYDDLLGDVIAELQEGLERALSAGIARQGIWIDPGLGFAKTAAQSISLLASTAHLRDLGYPLLVGPSRKRFVGEYTRLPDGRLPAPEERQPGTDAAVALAAFLGADAVRVHEVEQSRMAVQLGVAARRAEGHP